MSTKYPLYWYLDPLGCRVSAGFGVFGCIGFSVLGSWGADLWSFMICCVPVSVPL